MYRLRQRRASRVVFPLADAFGYVGLGFGTVAGAGDGDVVERSVELAVTASV